MWTYNYIPELYTTGCKLSRKLEVRIWKFAVNCFFCLFVCFSNHINTKIKWKLSWSCYNALLYWKKKQKTTFIYSNRCHVDTKIFFLLTNHTNQQLQPLPAKLSDLFTWMFPRYHSDMIRWPLQKVSPIHSIWRIVCKNYPGGHGGAAGRAATHRRS